MNLWEKAAKGFQGMGKALVNPKTYKGLENIINNAVTGIEGGYDSLQKNPYIGSQASAVGLHAQDMVSLYRNNNNAYRAAMAGALQLNPLTAAATPILAAYNNKIGSVTKEQEQNQLDTLKQMKKNADLSDYTAKLRKDMEGKGNIHSIAEEIKNQSVKAPLFIGEFGAGLASLGEAAYDLTQGEGFHPIKTYEEKYQPTFDELKKVNKNKVFFDKLPFMETGDVTEAAKHKLSELPDEIYTRLPDEVKADILQGNIESQYDFDSELMKATQSWERDSIVNDFFKAKAASGEMTPDEINNALQSYDVSVKQRQYGAEALTDPWMIPEIEALPFMAGKYLLKGAKAAKNVKTAAQTSKIDSYLKEIDNILDGIKSPQNKAANLTSEQNKVLSDQVKRMENLTGEDKTKLLSKINSVTEVSPVNTKSPIDMSLQNQVQDIKQTMPDFNNEEIGRVLTLQADEALKSNADEVANRVMQKMQSVSEDMFDPSLSSIYEPPKVDIVNGTMKPNPGKQVNPVEVQFRNSLQKTFYEMSLPWNRTIAEGYSMDWNDYKQRVTAITKNFAEPLTEMIYGNTAPENIKNVKRVLGSIGSELAKTVNNITPGAPLDFDNLKASKMLDDLLIDADSSVKAKRTIGEALKSKVLDPVTEAEDTIKGSYNNIVDYFESIGIPRQLARKAAPFYNKVLETTKLGDTKGLQIGTGDGLTAGKAYNLDMFQSPDGLERSIATELHEDFHSLFDYIRSAMPSSEATKLVKSHVLEGLDSQGKKYLNRLFKDIKSIGVESGIQVDELMAYFVQSKQELRKGVQTSNPVIQNFKGLMLKANNGDRDANKLLDNLEGLEQVVRGLGDDFEAKIIEDLRNTVLPNGSNAWDTINRIDVGNIKGALPGMNYGASKKSVAEYSGFMQDSAQRMERLKGLLNNQGTVYRGTIRPPSTGKVRTNFGSVDQVYGPGAYSSTNPEQAFAYTGLGPMKGIDDIKSMPKGVNPTLKEYYPDLERPLFWDEQVPLDVVSTLENSDNPVIQKAFETLGGVEGVSLYEMQDFITDLNLAVQDAIKPGVINATDAKEITEAAKEAGPLILEEVWNKAGYDGFVGPNTENILSGMSKGDKGFMEGLEVVPFSGHNLFERTSEIRKLDKIKSKKSTAGELSSITDQINNVSKNNVKRINYRINQGKK